MIDTMQPPAGTENPSESTNGPDVSGGRRVALCVLALFSAWMGGAVAADQPLGTIVFVALAAVIQGCVLLRIATPQAERPSSGTGR